MANFKRNPAVKLALEVLLLIEMGLSFLSTVVAELPSRSNVPFTFRSDPMMLNPKPP